MKPLSHPSVEAITVEGILHALSDPVRVQIFADLVGAGCPQRCSTFLSVREKEIPKSTLSQHFKTLREAGLIRSERHGVEMHNTSRCTEIDGRFPALIPTIIKAHQAQSAGNRPAARSVKRKAGP